MRAIVEGVEAQLPGARLAGVDTGSNHDAGRLADALGGGDEPEGPRAR